MTRKAALMLALAALCLGTTVACSTDPEVNPVAPSAVASESIDVAGAAPDAQTPVTLTGVIRGLNSERRQFMLVVASDDPKATSRAIGVDERTEVWAGGQRIRRRSLDNGMTIEVKGLEQERFVLARKITIVRRDRR